MITFLWTTQKDSYVLVSAEIGYSIVNKIRHTVLSISDEDLEDEIIQKSVGRELQSMFRHSRGLCRRIVSEKMFYRHKVECYLQKG